MRTLIEDYRGWEIYFDTDSETFYTVSENFDNQNTKKTYSSVKKWIDDFIKENKIFKHIWIETKPNKYNADKRIKLIGIRKDGRFFYKDEKGQKKQLAEYNEKDYILYNPENDKYWQEAEKYDVEIEILRNKRNDILKQITGVDLTEYKKQISF